MKTKRELDGWVGPVRQVAMERANFFNRAGEWVLGPRELDIISTYDEGGNKINESYGRNVIVGVEPRAGERVKQTATYDSEGHELTELAYNPDGTLGSKM